jgi:hypothetical protein
MSSTDCSNGEPRGFPLLWLSNVVSCSWPSLLFRVGGSGYYSWRMILGLSRMIPVCGSPMPHPTESAN